MILVGYTNPVIIGLMADGAGNWEWADGSPMDIDFLRAHSADQLGGVGENQVSHPHLIVRILTQLILT